MTQMLLPILVLLTVWAWPVARAADAQPPDRESLVSELATVRATLTQRQTDLTANNKDLWQQQHDLEYQDPEIVKIREEIIALEKQLIEKRKNLKTRLALKPEIKKIEAARKKLFDDVQALRDQEAVIQREISALDNAPSLEN